jgi:hypothetical protein
MNLFDPSLEMLLEWLHDSEINVYIEVLYDGCFSFNIGYGWKSFPSMRDMTRELALAALKCFPKSRFEWEYGDRLRELYGATLDAGAARAEEPK